MPPLLSENDIAYLKADLLEAGLRRTEKIARRLTWDHPAGYQRHLAEDTGDTSDTIQVAEAA